MEKIEQAKAAQREKFEKIKAEIESRRRFGRARLLKAFPNMKHQEFDDILQEIRDRLGNSVK